MGHTLQNSCEGAHSVGQNDKTGNKRESLLRLLEKKSVNRSRAACEADEAWMAFLKSVEIGTCELDKRRVGFGSFLGRVKRCQKLKTVGFGAPMRIR